MKRSDFILWLPCLVYYSFITFLSSIPSTKWAGIVKQPFENFDKLVHFVLYALLGMLVSRVLSLEEYYHHIKRRWIIYFAIIIPIAALIDEIHQYFVPTRTMDVRDWMVDIGGAVIGGVFYTLILRGRTRDAKSVQELEERDQGGFGLVLAMIFFLFIIFVNIFDFKVGLLKDYIHLGVLITLFEYGLIGFFTIRFFYLRRDRKCFHFLDWLGVLAFAMVFISLQQTSYWLLKKYLLSWPEMLWSMFSLLIGAIVYYLHKQIEKFRKKIWDDPLYKRKTWQRVYYFLPPLLLAVLIAYFSMNVEFHFLVESILFLILGLFYFRAIAWECWWQGQRNRIWIWSVSSLLFVILAILSAKNAMFQMILNLSSGLISFGIYLYGYRYVKQKYFAEREKEFEV